MIHMIVASVQPSRDRDRVSSWNVGLAIMACVVSTFIFMVSPHPAFRTSPS